MQKNIVWIVIAVAVVAGLGGYYLFAKSPSADVTRDGRETNVAADAAKNNQVIQTKKDAKLGDYLADADGKALYVYGQDESNTSKCTGSCLDAWPAYEVSPKSSGQLPERVGTFKRTDNSRVQYTYNDKPLYYYASDTSAGQVAGNGVGGFAIAKP